MLLLDPDDVLGATRRLGEVRRHADDTPAGCEVMQQSSGPWIRATRHADWVHTQLDVDFARIGLARASGRLAQGRSTADLGPAQSGPQLVRFNGRPADMPRAGRMLKEHGPPVKHLLVDGGVGSGKTSTLVNAWTTTSTMAARKCHDCQQMQP